MRGFFDMFCDLKDPSVLSKGVFKSLMMLISSKVGISLGGKFLDTSLKFLAGKKIGREVTQTG